MPGFKNSLRDGKRFGSFPPAFADRRFRVWDSEPANGFPVFFPDEDTGFRFCRASFVVFTADKPVLPVDFLDVFFFHIKDIALPSIPVAFANLSDTISADEQIDHKAKDGKADHVDEILQKIIQHGHACLHKRNNLDDHKNHKTNDICDHPVCRGFLDCFAEDDFVHHCFERYSDDKTDQSANRHGPAGELCNDFAKAISQR